METIAAVTKEHINLVVSHLDHASGYLQVLFKNTDRVRQLDEDLKGTVKATEPPPIVQIPSAPGQKTMFDGESGDLPGEA